MAYGPALWKIESNSKNHKRARQRQNIEKFWLGSRAWLRRFWAAWDGCIRTLNSRNKGNRWSVGRYRVPMRRPYLDGKMTISWSGVKAEAYVGTSRQRQNYRDFNIRTLLDLTFLSSSISFLFALMELPLPFSSHHQFFQDHSKTILPLIRPPIVFCHMPA